MTATTSQTALIARNPYVAKAALEELRGRLNDEQGELIPGINDALAGVMSLIDLLDGHRLQFAHHQRENADLVSELQKQRNALAQELTTAHETARKTTLKIYSWVSTLNLMIWALLMTKCRYSWMP